jgi:hypothetical protein
MKKINFPQPAHEQAVEVLEEAKNKLAALGFTAGYTASMKCDNVQTVETYSPLSGETSTAKPYAVFQASFMASIEV